MIDQIISGGQTGIDFCGLEVAKSLGIKTGGTAPKGYLTEDGNNPKLKEYGLVEDEYVFYINRTRLNIVNSDCTVVFGDIKSPGTQQTIKICKELNKPIIINPDVAALVLFLKGAKIKIVNIAGNRGSKLKAEDLEKYKNILTESLIKCQQK